MMTLWHYQKNHNLQQYFYYNGNSFLDWKVFFSMNASWSARLVYSDWKFKIQREKSPSVALQLSKAVRVKSSHSKRNRQYQPAL